MDLLGWFRRTPPETHATRTTLQSPRPTPYHRPEWASVPPLQRIVGPQPLITAPERFAAGLTAWADPSLLSAPGHLVSAAAPSGLGHGLAEPVPAAAPAPDPAPRTWAPPPRPAGPSVQRETGQPESGQPENGQTGVRASLPAAVARPVAHPPIRRAEHGPAVPRPAVPLPVGPRSDLTSAEHAPMPPPLRFEAAPVQRAATEDPGTDDPVTSDPVTGDRGTDHAAGGGAVDRWPAAAPPDAQEAAGPSTVAEEFRPGTPAPRDGVAPTVGAPIAGAPAEPSRPATTGEAVAPRRLGLGAPMVQRRSDAPGPSDQSGPSDHSAPPSPASTGRPAPQGPGTPVAVPPRSSTAVQRSVESVAGRPSPAPSAVVGPSLSSAVEHGPELGADLPVQLVPMPPAAPAPSSWSPPLTTVAPGVGWERSSASVSWSDAPARPDTGAESAPDTVPGRDVSGQAYAEVSTLPGPSRPVLSGTGTSGTGTSGTAVQRAVAPPFPASARQEARRPDVERSGAPTAVPWSADREPSRPGGRTTPAGSAGPVVARSVVAGSVVAGSARPTGVAGGSVPVPALAPYPLPEAPRPAPEMSTVQEWPAAFVQRAAEAVPGVPASALPPTVQAVQAAPTTSSPPAAGAPTSATEIDALVSRLYDPFVRRLKAELRLDRERVGHALDLRQ